MNVNTLKAGVKYLEFKILGRYTSTWCLHNPIHAEIDVTGRCNFNCVWCYRKMDLPDAIDADVSHMVDVIYQLKGCKRINLCALGEPLLIPVDNMRIVISACKKMCDETIITTNGSLLKGDMADLIVDLEVDKVAVSIDHYDKEKYKLVRGFNLDVIVDNVKVFRKKYNGVLQLNTVVTEQTIDDMVGMVDFAGDIGFNSIIFQPVKLYPGNDIGYIPPVGIYKNRMVIEKIKKRAEKYNINVSFHRLLFNIPDRMICKQPFYQLSMDVNGFINPCCADKSEHLVYIDNLRDAWNCRAVRDFRRKVIRGNLPLICRSWCENERKG